LNREGAKDAKKDRQSAKRAKGHQRIGLLVARGMRAMR
jgi:hypothetical protein